MRFRAFLLYPGAGVSVQWTPTISMYAGYDGQLGRAQLECRHWRGAGQLVNSGHEMA
jgi:hypothetical protein